MIGLPPETLGPAETRAPGDSVPLSQASALIAASGADYPELPAKVKAKHYGEKPGCVTGTSVMDFIKDIP
ncbi:MAG TPA: hypothetical protein HPP90_05225 [Deltaproteobacteria bacterium]|nr:hypothetical protein [Deltaproteobacteria bacterium]